MLIVSCGNRGSVPVVVDTACDWVKPIYLTDNDIATMEKQTKRDVLAHNKSWKANCRKESDRERREPQ
ncbi:hypothetical protein [Salmonella enterica]|uniref:hypothetical protein n=1 Tax=Salmonella enterica TaxID=28901 RepID=UPI001F14006C|nr:hypothetical protein [Salmonella enterica]EDU1088595.1 hypothetical protein [Salmonella enterica subsp. enterica serovar Coleypark]EDV0489824.1 hypothetical protein [Salmonella enterica subsp. enterica serovar Bareilly]MDJ4728672.1 hypothetical protein [Salmonella enterica]MDJ4941714.1 hypothetical protein [Salmonella enterica]